MTGSPTRESRIAAHRYARRSRCLPRRRWPAARRSAILPVADKDDPLYASSQSNLTSLSEVIDKHPTIRRPTTCAARPMAKPGCNEQALADFNKAISLDPHYAQAYANRGLVYRRTNKLDLALADYDKALSIDAVYPPAYLGRGIVHSLQGTQRAGARRFQQGDRTAPRQRGGLLQSRAAVSEPAQHQFAIDDFSTAIGLARKRPSPMSRARVVSRHWRRQVGGQGSRQGGADRSADAGLDQPRAGLRTSRHKRKRPPAPTPRRSTSTTSTRPPSPASPASAARPDRPIRRSTSLQVILDRREAPSGPILTFASRSGGYQAKTPPCRKSSGALFASSARICRVRCAASVTI